MNATKVEKIWKMSHGEIKAYIKYNISPKTYKQFPISSQDLLRGIIL